MEPYDFTRSIVSALQHCGPDRVVALGPGNALGGPLARTLVAARWRNVRTRADFEVRNREDPLLLSLGVELQRRLLA